MRSKRNFTLIEVMIGLVLAGALFGMLMQFYKSLCCARVDAEKIKERIFYRQCMQHTLMGFFAHICPMQEDLVGMQTMAFSGCKGEGLFFSYENGVDPDPRFCGKLQAAVFLDMQGAVQLVTSFETRWVHKPSEIEELVRLGQARTRVLCRHVNALRFAFFDEKKASWVHTLSEEDSLPVMVRLYVDEDGAPLEYSYFIRQPEEVILYERKRV